eukprot:Em0008g173a
MASKRVHSGSESISNYFSKKAKDMGKTQDEDIVHAYNLIHSVISDIAIFRENIEKDFHDWFMDASRIGSELGIVLTVPRLSGRQQHRANAGPENPDPEVYYSGNSILGSHGTSTKPAIDFIVTIALFATLQATQAPGDGSSECQNPPFIKTPFPSNIVTLMDSYDYLYLTVAVGGPWSTLDVDGDTRTWAPAGDSSCRQVTYSCSYNLATQNNWLITQHINTTVNGKALSQVVVRVNFSLNGCPTGGSCQQSFLLQMYQTRNVDPSGSINLTNYAPFSGSRVTVGSNPSGTVVETQDVTVQLGASGGLYLAAQDTGTCVSITRLTVLYYVCPQQVVNFISYPMTLADGGVCSCNPGYTNIGQTCKTCPPGTYKSAQGSSGCLPCPSNSNSSVNGSSQCPCLQGYYRPAGSGADSGCIVARPPSAPQNLTMGTISATAVVLSWTPPQDSGGMGTVFYTVYYQALISGSLRMTWGTVTTTSVSVTNLLPATEYRMTVVAQNGLPGDEGNRSISIRLTTQSASSTSSTPVIVGVVVAVVALVGVLLFVLLLVGMLKHTSKRTKSQGDAVTLSQIDQPQSVQPTYTTTSGQETTILKSTQHADTMYQPLSKEFMSSPSTYAEMKDLQSTHPIQSMQHIPNADTMYQPLSKEFMSSPSTYAEMKHLQSTHPIQSMQHAPNADTMYQPLSKEFMSSPSTYAEMKHLQSTQPVQSMQHTPNADTMYQPLSKEFMSSPSTYAEMKHLQSTQPVQSMQHAPNADTMYLSLTN